MPEPSAINLTISNRNRSLSNDKFNLLIKRRILIQNMFDILMEKICLCNNRTQDILPNFKKEMGEIYNLNKSCIDMATGESNIAEINILKENIQNIKDNISKYPDLINNNIYNLFIFYSLIMLIKKLYNFIIQNQRPSATQKLYNILEELRDFSIIFYTQKSTIPTESIYNILKSFNENNLTSDDAVFIKATYNTKKIEIDNISKAISEKKSTDVLNHAIIQQKYKLSDEQLKIFIESNDVLSGAKNCAIELFNNNTVLNNAIDSIDIKEQPKQKPITIADIFNIILDALKFIEENNKHRKAISILLKSFENFNNGSLMGVLVYDSVKSIDPIPTGKLITETFDALSQIPATIDTNVLELANNGLKESVIPVVISNTVHNDDLDILLKRAKIFTLAPSNDKFNPQINKILNQISDLLSMYGTYDSEICEVYKIFDEGKIERILNNILKGGLLNPFLKKVCGYIQRNNTLPVNVSFSGGAIVNNSFIDIENILKNKLDLEIKCTFVKNSKCKFCEQWNAERIMFKKIVSEMIKQNNILEVL